MMCTFNPFPTSKISTSLPYPTPPPCWLGFVPIPLPPARASSTCHSNITSKETELGARIKSSRGRERGAEDPQQLYTASLSFLSCVPVVAHYYQPPLPLFAAPARAPTFPSHHPPRPPKPGQGTTSKLLRWLGVGAWITGPRRPGVRVQEGAIIRATAATNLLRSWIGSRRAGPLQPSKKPSQNPTNPPFSLGMRLLLAR